MAQFISDDQRNSLKQNIGLAVAKKFDLSSRLDNENDSAKKSDLANQIKEIDDLIEEAKREMQAGGFGKESSKDGALAQQGAESENNRGNQTNSSAGRALDNEKSNEKKSSTNSSSNDKEPSENESKPNEEDLSWEEYEKQRRKNTEPQNSITSHT